LSDNQASPNIKKEYKLKLSNYFICINKDNLINGVYKNKMNFRRNNSFLSHCTNPQPSISCSHAVLNRI
jgi:hypothetical protein